MFINSIQHSKFCAFAEAAAAAHSGSPGVGGTHASNYTIKISEMLRIFRICNVLYSILYIQCKIDWPPCSTSSVFHPAELSGPPMWLLLHYFTVGDETVCDRDAPPLRNCWSSEAMQVQKLILDRLWSHIILI